MTGPQAAPRYAVYFCPEEDTDFWTHGNAWLGRDIRSDQPINQPNITHFPKTLLWDLTRSPRHYGLHATLKAPFRLAPGQTVDALLSATTKLTESLTSIIIPALEVANLGDFLALRPVEESPQLSSLTSRCVTTLDHFRAPLTKADLQRRNPEALDTVERHNLMTYGYPYVHERFRFHLTLSNSLPNPVLRQKLRDAAEQYFSHICTQSVPVNSVCVCVQNTIKEPFVLLKRLPLQP